MLKARRAITGGPRKIRPTIYKNYPIETRLKVNNIYFFHTYEL